VIEFSDFCFRYWGQARPALNHITLRIGNGEFVLVAGQSGSGKSSLCRCINGLIPHFHGGQLQGTVRVDGLDTSVHQPRDLAERVGMVFQDPENQLIALDVERDIAFGLENRGVAVEEIDRRVGAVLDVLGIGHLRRASLQTLSGGQKQMAAIAAALAVRPRVLVLDEPTSELDPFNAEKLLSTVARLRRELGITVILIEHRLERGVRYVDRVVVLKDGAVVADGSPRSVLDDDAVASSGVGLPPLARLAAELRRRGLWSGTTPLDVDEAAPAFAPLLHGKRGVRRGDSAASAREALLTLEDVHFGYNGGSPVLRGVSHNVREGELLVLMGCNGSGKTTLVKHYNGLLRPLAGRVRVGQLDSAMATVSTLARSVGLVFQNPNDHLFADTVEGEVLFTLHHLGVEEAESHRRLEDALALFGLEAYRGHYPRSLSGGERQRVALASVVAAHPRVLVLDEPTRGLEHERKSTLMRFLKRYAAEGRAVVLVTHDVETAAEYADRVLLLQDGVIAGDGDPHDVLPRSEVFRPEICRLALTGLMIGGGSVITVDDLLGVLA